MRLTLLKRLTVLAVLGSLAPGALAAGPLTGDTFIQGGYSDGFSVLGASDINYPVAGGLSVGGRVEYLLAPNYGSTGYSASALVVKPYLRYNAPLTLIPKTSASVEIIVRPELAILPTSQQALRFQVGLNSTTPIPGNLTLYAGTGVGTQLGLVPTVGLLYNYFYTYTYTQIPLASNLNVEPGLNLGINLDGKFSNAGYSARPYVALNYTVNAAASLRGEVGYGYPRYYGDFDNPEAKGLYAAVRAKLHF